MEDLRTDELIARITAELFKLDPEFNYVWSDEEPVWYLQFGEHDVMFMLTDSRCRDGEEWDSKEGGGFNVLWDATNASGCLVAGFCPYNYSRQIWTLDEDEFERRIEWALEVLREFVKGV